MRSHLRFCPRKSLKVDFLFQNSRVDWWYEYHLSSFSNLYRFNQSIFENFHPCGISKNPGIEPSYGWSMNCRGTGKIDALRIGSRPFLFLHNSIWKLLLPGQKSIFRHFHPLLLGFISWMATFFEKVIEYIYLLNPDRRVKNLGGPSYVQVQKFYISSPGINPGEL